LDAVAPGSDFSDSFAARLGLALDVLNLSRGQLAAAVGVDKSVVSRWVSGNTEPTAYNRARISEALAKVKPGFNMTLWDAPRASFDAFLGISSAAPPAKAAWRGRWIGGALLAGALFIIAASTLWWAMRDAAVHEAAGGSVAVLPLRNLTGSPARLYLAEGISDAVIGELSRIAGLKVAARTSAFAAAGSGDAQQIARRLGVGHVVDGSVSGDERHLRVDVELVDARNGFVVWSEHYERQGGNGFALAHNLAAAIAASLGRKLAAAAPQPGIDPALYRDYALANFLFEHRTRGDSARAIALLKNVTARAENFAPGWGLLAKALFVHRAVFEREIASAQAIDAITRRALALDGGNPDGLVTAVYRALEDQRWDDARDAIHRLLRFHPGLATAQQALGVYADGLGLSAEARTAYKRGIELDPLSMVAWFNLGASEEKLGRIGEARADYERALALYPGQKETRWALCSLEAQAGHIAKAEAWLRSAPAAGAGREMVECPFAIAIAAHKTAEARAMLAQFAGAAGPGDFKYVACRHIHLGDAAEATAWFERAWRAHESFLWLKYDGTYPRWYFATRQWQDFLGRTAGRAWSAARQRALKDRALFADHGA
jgi:TolB-like protein/Flp pilus assembly protein TadD